MKNYLKICVLLRVLLLLNWSAWSIRAEDIDDFDSPIARQIMRLAKSAEIRNFMKPEVKACDDFYTFSCGNWRQVNPPNDKSSKKLFNTLKETYYRKITKFLNGDKESSDIELVRKVKYFYESCLQRDYMKLNRRQVLLNIMEEFGGMPALKGTDWHEESFDWLQVTAKILRKYGKPIIIGVEVEPDFTNTTISRIYIGQDRNMVSAKVDSYFKYLTEFWKMELETVFGLSPTKALITATEMVEFAEKLSLGVSDPFSGLGKQDENKLISLSDMTDKFGPTVNLTSFVEIWLGYDYRQPVYEYVEKYLRNLKTVIPDTAPTTVANYIMMQLITDFDYKVDLEEEEYRRTCVQATYNQFYQYIDHLMYKDLEKFHPKNIQDAVSIFQHLKQTFTNILKSPSMMWMAESTRDKALEKLSAMTFEIYNYGNINFTQELGTLTISSGDFFENIISISELRGEYLRTKVNKPNRHEDQQTHFASFPRYLTNYNLITMPVYFLQPLHLWESAYPKAILYGTIGYIIAHEMIHAFDDNSRKYDAKGNLNNWWDRNSSAIFETRKECLRQQYNSFEYGGYFLADQGETIADVSGLRIAYEAYDEWLSSHHQTPEHLPHMDTTTARQLFFISAAQIWCSVTESVWSELNSGASPQAVRVKGMMSNSNAFAEAFECEVNSPMNPQKKCFIY